MVDVTTGNMYIARQRLVNQRLAGEPSARTQRGWWKTSLTYQMFYHVDHHLFPAVPTLHLPELAVRLDRAAPHLRERQVF
jgi:fatty acid desaturase